MARIYKIWLLIVAFVSLASALGPTFCKCTCFKNSTILPLGPEHQSEVSDTSSLLRRSLDLFKPGPAVQPDVARRTASKSCSECTKAFCLGQGIDFCKDATEDDVATMCFRRDSNKDKIIVWSFILGTTGLLGWAIFKRFVAWREQRSQGAYARPGTNYAPFAGRR